MDIIGQSLAGKYRVKSEIGQGGMGVVYEAYDAMLRRRVAVKVLAPHLASDPTFVKRFQHEAAAAASLHHPNIVTIHDVGMERVAGKNGRQLHYIVMQFVEGQGLDRWLQRQKRPLAVGEIGYVIRQVAEALQYAHDHGMIHRDVKPSNVMVGADGHVTLMDFGLVRAGEMSQLTQSGVAMGTPSYMAPEQIMGEAVDRRTDVYALGVVIYELLAGQAPFVRATPVATAHAHVYDPPPPLRERRPDLSPAVEAVVLKALAKAPAERYAETRLLVADLVEASTGHMPAGLAGKAGAADPTVPMAQPPRPPAVDAAAAAERPVGRPPMFSEETISSDQPLPQQPVATPDPDLTLAASCAEPISAWSSLPDLSPRAVSTPPPISSPASSPQPATPPPVDWSQPSSSQDRRPWIVAGAGLLVAALLLLVGLVEGSLSLTLAGVVVGVAVLAVTLAVRASRMRAASQQAASSEPSCLRCGHALSSKDAVCPSCGYQEIA